MSVPPSSHHTLATNKSNNGNGSHSAKSGNNTGNNRSQFTDGGKRASKKIYRSKDLNDSSQGNNQPSYNVKFQTSKVDDHSDFEVPTSPSYISNKGGVFRDGLSAIDVYPINFSFKGDLARVNGK